MNVPVPVWGLVLSIALAWSLGALTFALVLASIARQRRAQEADAEALAERRAAWRRALEDAEAERAVMKALEPPPRPGVRR